MLLYYSYAAVISVFFAVLGIAWGILTGFSVGVGIDIQSQRQFCHPALATWQQSSQTHLKLVTRCNRQCG